MISADKKVVFHSDLKNESPVVVRVTGDVFRQKSKNHPCVEIQLEDTGNKHVYWIENDNCAPPFTVAEKGVPLNLTATGMKDDALIMLVPLSEAQQMGELKQQELPTAANAVGDSLGADMEACWFEAGRVMRADEFTAQLAAPVFIERQWAMCATLFIQYCDQAGRRPIT